MQYKNIGRDHCYVYTPVCLSVCLSVCEQGISKNCGRIWTKFGGHVGCLIRSSRFEFYEDPDPDPDGRGFFFLKCLFAIDRCSQNRYTPQYSMTSNGCGWIMLKLDG